MTGSNAHEGRVTATVPASLVLQVVVAAICAESGLSPDGVVPELALAAIPGMESVRVLRAVAAMEDHLGVSVPDDFEFEEATIGELVARLESLVGAAAATGRSVRAGEGVV